MPQISRCSFPGQQRLICNGVTTGKRDAKLSSRLLNSTSLQISPSMVTRPRITSSWKVCPSATAVSVTSSKATVRRHARIHTGKMRERSILQIQNVVLLYMMRRELASMNLPSAFAEQCHRSRLCGTVLAPAVRRRHASVWQHYVAHDLFQAQPEGDTSQGHKAAEGKPKAIVSPPRNKQPGED